jgi:uncharacterized protein YceH (UPF0502 family)
MELTRAEGRVLGCLIELEALAPGEVPLSLNNLRLACNQTTGRDPVVAYDDRTVEDTLLQLKSRGLARFVPPSAEAPTTRYRHRADERWRMGSAELAVLSVLLVQRVLTVSQVRAGAQRLHPLMTASEVDAVLDSLAARTPNPFAARVGARAGAREVRWVEVLTGPVPDDVPDEAGGTGATGGGSPSAAGTVAATGPAGPAGTAVERVEAARPGVVGDETPSFASLAARVADLERRLADALGDRPAPDRPPSRAVPPPQPQVEVTPPPARPLGRATPATWRDDRPSASVRTAVAPAESRVEVDVDELASRLRDVERRLARIEAELGALR